MYTFLVNVVKNVLKFCKVFVLVFSGVICYYGVVIGSIVSEAYSFKSMIIYRGYWYSLYYIFSITEANG